MLLNQKMGNQQFVIIRVNLIYKWLNIDDSYACQLTVNNPIGVIYLYFGLEVRDWLTRTNFSLK